MGLYIEGMEMPKAEFGSMIFAIRPDGMVEDVMGCYVGKAVSVPELHGRLGDLDALPWYLANTSVKYATYEDWEMLCDAIAAAPTIIPASEGGET